MKKRRAFMGGAVLALASIAMIAVVVGSSGNASPTGDHWVDNLGSGTTASNFDGNVSSDCSTAAFQAAGYDLWSFVVNQASDPTTQLSWNGAQSVWANPSSVTVQDVTADYGPYTSGDGTKHLWIATTPPGATLVKAYLNYDGSAGRENLSHACGRAEAQPGIRIDPAVAYDMTWDWAIDKTVDWAVNPAGGYTLDYSVEANRSEHPRIVNGSLHVTDGIVVIPPTLVLTGLTVTFTQGSYTQPCAVDMTTLHYDCTLDVSKITKDATTGRPTGSGTLSAVGTYSGGTLTDSADVTFDGVDPTAVFAITASMSDDNATPADATDDRTTTENQFDYSVNWTPTGATCSERTNTATLTIDNPPSGMEDPSDSVTVRWCPPMSGRTIGYWGNKAGAPLVRSNIVALKTKYPSALISVPTFTTDAAVRNFFGTATCSGDCKSMFAAQFLATAMNALDTGFAAQGVEFGGECISVSDLLVEANIGAATATAKSWYESYKSILDAINNSRQTPCLTVID